MESSHLPQRQPVLRQGVETASAFLYPPGPGTGDQGPRTEGCAVSSSCRQGPKFPQSEHSGDSGPRLTGRPTLPHIWSASNFSALSYARGRAAGSSAEGEEEENRKQLSKHASDFPKWRRGRAKLSGGSGFRPRTQQRLPPLHGSPQQVTPGDITTHPIQKVFSGLWILNSGIISEGVMPRNSSPHPSWGKRETFSAAARSSLLSLSSKSHSPLPPEATSKPGGIFGSENWFCLPSVAPVS